ncbi:hypothetical protein Taro_023275 [Colocasia esculenta]|uniref:Uncharacterized protein n=1 Tax=Colocasia esculenta TaxID=4460 RepID=A0A843V472_COLES|nr:hypothetical protein [Colocasia esculenta]
MQPYNLTHKNSGIALSEHAPLGFLLTLLIEEGSVHHRLMYVSTARKWLSTDTVLPEPVFGLSTAKKGLSTDSSRQSSAFLVLYLFVDNNKMAVDS